MVKILTAVAIFDVLAAAALVVTCRHIHRLPFGALVLEGALPAMKTLAAVAILDALAFALWSVL